MTNLTVVIPNYNGIDYLEGCFNSLQKQGYPHQVVIIDNGSDDESTTYLKENYPQHTLIKNKKNLGFATAVNQGIKASNTDYVFLMNNDVELENNCLENLAKCLEEDPEIFAVSSQMVQYQDRSKLDDAGDEYSLLGWTRKIGENKPPDDYNQRREVFSACAGASLYRRNILEELGCFDENFFAYLEDVDLSYRARINGYKCLYCPDAVAYHHTSATTGSRYNPFKIKLSARNNVYLPYKNMPWPQLLVNSPFLLLGYLIKYLFFLKRGEGKHYRQGLKEGFKSLNKIERIKYKKDNRANYFKIEWSLIKNVFKFL